MNHSMLAMLRQSCENRTGVELYLPNHTVAIVVTKLVGTEAVVGYNQDYDHVQVRLDQVIAVAMN